MPHVRQGSLATSYLFKRFFLICSFTWVSSSWACCRFKYALSNCLSCGNIISTQVSDLSAVCSKHDYACRYPGKPNILDLKMTCFLSNNKRLGCVTLIFQSLHRMGKRVGRTLFSLWWYHGNNHIQVLTTYINNNMHLSLVVWLCSCNALKQGDTDGLTAYYLPGRAWDTQHLMDLSTFGKKHKRST